MRECSLNEPDSTVFARNKKGVRFLLLGKDSPKKLSPQARQKIAHARKSSVTRLWGTLRTWY